MDQAQKHRDACDACHYRKIRCPFAGPGACSNCQRFGRVCAFSPRDEMGRPKRSTAKKGRESSTKKSTAKTSPPKKQDDSDQPLQCTEDNNMSDAFTKEDSTVPAETIDMNFADEWQNLLSFPADERDPIFSPAAMLANPLTNHTINDMPFLYPTPGPSNLPTPPLSIPFQRQDVPIDLEHVSSDGTDIFTGPGPPLHSRKNSLQSNISNGNMDASLETHRMLSKVLYDLRLEYGKQWPTPESESPRRDGLFRSVSLLCDIVQEILTGRDVLAETPANIDSETSITFMLTLTGISMILNIYKSLCQMYSACPDVMETGMRASDTDQLFEPLAIPPSSNASASLDKIVHLTTMDFHLARLQRMFSMPNAPSHFQMALLGTGEGEEQIHELRTTLQRLIEWLKTS